VNADRIIEAIDSITRETGYPPSPEELAEVLGISRRSLHSTLLPFKRGGVVRYDDDGNLVTKPPR
jgi:DNA-directed RNA polymerase specialized sigma subunit